MTRFSKEQLPQHHTLSKVLHSRKRPIAFALVALSIIGFLTYQRFSAGTSPAESQDDIGVDFVQVPPHDGELVPIVWKDGAYPVSPNAYRVSIPPKLIRALNEYCDKVGLTDLARNYILSADNNIKPGGFEFVTLKDGLVWYAQRPDKKWFSDMHWISPADERTHEAYLKLINENGFLSVLNEIGDQLDLDGLAAYHLTIIVVSHCEQGFVHHDTTGTDDKVFNVIIPLEMVHDSPPELIIEEYSEERYIGRLKYEENVAVMLGDDARHATSECDYRDKPGTMRLAATVYIADINEDNTASIVGETLTQAFPLPDTNWVYSQRARHWENSNLRTDLDDEAEAKHFVGERGRAEFTAFDEDEAWCVERLAEDTAGCETQFKTRMSCPATCGVYLDSYSLERMTKGSVF